MPISGASSLPVDAWLASSNTAPFGSGANDAFSAICCWQNARFTSGKSSSFAIVSNKNALVIALPHWGGIAFKWNLFMALAVAAFRRETASCRRKCHQDFWVKLVWQRLQVTVTTPLPRGRRSHALQLGQRKYLYCLRFLKRFFA